MVLRCVDAKTLYFSIVLIYFVQIGLIVITVFREKSANDCRFSGEKKAIIPIWLIQGSKVHPGAVKLTLKEAQAPGAIETYPGTKEAHPGAIETALGP
jgi:uncharacterized alpha/beta hydrolase family protein